MKTVKQNLNPEKTLIISFEQTKKGRKHEFMMLTVHNPFPYKLEYKAFMFLMKHKRWVPTDVLPIQPKLDGIEMWPDIIVTMAMSKWKFI